MFLEASKIPTTDLPKLGKDVMIIKEHVPAIKPTGLDAELLEVIRSNGTVVAVAALVQRGADPDKANAMHFCAAFENLDILRWLIEHGCDLEQRDPTKQTPLMAAGALAKGQSVQLLFAADADSFAVNEDGKSVLDLFYDYVLHMDDFSKAMGMPQLANQAFPKDNPRGLEIASYVLCKFFSMYPGDSSQLDRSYPDMS